MAHSETGNSFETVHSHTASFGNSVSGSKVTFQESRLTHVQSRLCTGFDTSNKGWNVAQEDGGSFQILLNPTKVRDYQGHRPSTLLTNNPSFTLALSSLSLKSQRLRNHRSQECHSRDPRRVIDVGRNKPS